MTAEYMGAKELVQWLTVYGPQEALHAAKRLIEDVEAASKEVARLQSVVREHARKLSEPIAAQYSADLTIETNPHFLNTITRIRLSPMLHKVRVPFLVGEWAEDFKRAFHDEVATAVGQIAGKRLAKELWPNEPQPQPV